MTKRPPHHKIKAWGRGYWRRVGAQHIDAQRAAILRALNPQGKTVTFRTYP